MGGGLTALGLRGRGPRLIAAVLAGPQWATDLLEAEELWAAAAGSLITAIVLQAVARARPLPPGLWAPLVLTVGLAAGTATGSRHRWEVVLVAAAVALVGALVARRGAPVATGVAASVLAAGAVYTCLPDTEVARGLLGAVATSGALAVVLHRPWFAAAWTVTASLIAATVVDGHTRSSALVGGVAIAVIHGLVTLPERPPRAAPALHLAVAAVAMGICSRVAGRGPDTARAVAIAVACVLVVAAVGLLGGDSAGRARQDLRPPLRDH